LSFLTAIRETTLLQRVLLAPVFLGSFHERLPALRTLSALSRIASLKRSERVWYKWYWIKSRQQQCLFFFNNVKLSKNGFSNGLYIFQGDARTLVGSTHCWHQHVAECGPIFSLSLYEWF
jgi:hypothetical protein